jgi:hypothetical protein
MSSSPEIRNSIIWGNTAGSNPGISNSSSTPVVSYSIVEGSGGSGGNLLDTDPAFEGWIDPAAGGWTATSGGDYRLTNDSSAIDAGDKTLYPAGADAVQTLAGITLSTEAKAAIDAVLAEDLGGGTRMQGAAIDMGAYEKQ